MIICKEFVFDSAHKLNNYEGKCAFLHGHTYKLHVYVEGEIQENGLVMDFGDLKSYVTKNVLDKVDHKFLNDFIEQPSAENISVWIWNQLVDDVPLYKIQLWETPTSFVVYRGK